MGKVNNVQHSKDDAQARGDEEEEDGIGQAGDQLANQTGRTGEAIEKLIHTIFPFNLFLCCFTPV